jgi:Threonyl-tRNA synthetase
MRILLIHSDHLKYQTKSKTRIAEEISDEKKKGQFENALVVFTAVEKEDEAKPEAVVENAVKEIMDVSEKIKAENIVIYPYAHLSSSLGAPDAAKNILSQMETELLTRKLPVNRVPFGWYKSFEVSCKGHPLSELSRSITTETVEEEKEEPEGEESKFYILKDGELLNTGRLQLPECRP